MNVFMASLLNKKGKINKIMQLKTKRELKPLSISLNSIKLKLSYLTDSSL